MLFDLPNLTDHHRSLYMLLTPLEPSINEEHHDVISTAAGDIACRAVTLASVRTQSAARPRLAHRMICFYEMHHFNVFVL